MTREEEAEMHDLAMRLEALTRPSYGWESMRYVQIGEVLKELTTYCAVCSCKSKPAESAKDEIKRLEDELYLKMLKTALRRGWW